MTCTGSAWSQTPSCACVSPPPGPWAATSTTRSRSCSRSVGAYLGGAGETYALGDSPLVLLTALQSIFEPDSTSSQHVDRPTPSIADDGSYADVPGARPMRVYTWVDTRLMFEDFYLKLAEFERWQQTSDAAGVVS